MKKYLGLLFIVIALTGCSKSNDANMKDKFVKDMSKKETYLMKGTMNIISNEDTFTYSITAAKDKNLYRVNLVNQVNNHEQVILKSTDGVYVVTPNLNKSFKFQSEWPDNGSQAYLIDSLVKDIKNDSTASSIKEKDKYIISAKVNYPNNSSLVNEKIYLDKKSNIIKVDVLDADNKIKITVNYTKIDFKPTFKDDYFKLESLIDENCCKEETTGKTIDDIIYPLYLPTNTYLNSKDTVNTDTGNRVILTFTGDSPFTLVEEKASASKEFEIIPVYGEPLMLSTTMGALSSNSLYWTSNDVDYYLSSDKLSSSELLSIAESVSSGSLSVSGEK
jgi:outer membrane lipoprotein-sorting protein